MFGIPTVTSFGSVVDLAITNRHRLIPIVRQLTCNPTATHRHAIAFPVTIWAMPVYYMVKLRIFPAYGNGQLIAWRCLDVESRNHILAAVFRSFIGRFDERTGPLSGIDPDPHSDPVADTGPGTKTSAMPKYKRSAAGGPDGT
jgi:hypothetical protein